MTYLTDDNELAALAARRAALATMDAHRRATRLTEARQREDALFAEVDRLVIHMGSLLRRFKKSDTDHKRPTALRQPGRVADEITARRDAA